MSILVLSLFFYGCSSKNMSVTASESEMISDKNKAHILFSRPSNLMGGAYNIYIMEFDESTFEPKLVAILDSGERSIYSLNEGKHFFYTNVVANENIIEMDVEKGKLYYVNNGVTPNTIFYPLVYTDQRTALKTKIESLLCSRKTLDKYLFKEVVEDESKNTYSNQSSNKSIKYTSSIYIEIECNDDKIIKVSDRYLYKTIKELKDEADLVKLKDDAYLSFEKSDRAEFKEEIKDLYPLWKIKFKDVPFTESPFIRINKDVSDEYFQAFDRIQVVNKSTNVKNEDIDNSIKSTFGSINKGSKTLTVEYIINKYDDGSMAGRYLTMGIAKHSYLDSIGVIDLSINFLTEDSEVIGSIRITEIEAGGILGGINTLISDVVNEVKEYTLNNFIKKD